MKNGSLNLFRKRNILHRLKADGMDEGGGVATFVYNFMLSNDL